MTGTDRWRLDNRRALVTGGTRGIGLAIAEELLGLGAQVSIVARSEADIAARIADWQARGLPAHGIAADVATDAGRAAALDHATHSLGGVDILINNVGANIRRPTVDFTPGEYEHLLQTNLTSIFAISRAAHPLLCASESGGCIVNIGSVAGTVSVGSGLPYAITKAAVDQMTRYLAVEWAGDNIRVNAVNPWYTRTPLASAVLDNPDFRARVVAATPLRRIAEPEDVAGLVAFLCLPAARHITGQTIAVDGGFLAAGWMP